jgi:hypothetical protein
MKTAYHQMMGWLMIWKEVVMVYFKVLSKANLSKIRAQPFLVRIAVVKHKE